MRVAFGHQQEANSRNYKEIAEAAESANERPAKIFVSTKNSLADEMQKRLLELHRSIRTRTVNLECMFGEIEGNNSHLFHEHHLHKRITTLLPGTSMPSGDTPSPHR